MLRSQGGSAGRRSRFPRGLVRICLVLAVLAALVAGASVADAELSQSGDLRIAFDGGFVPQALPRDRPAPVAVEVEGAVSTTDGSHPPPLRSMRIAINRNGRISTVGLPLCSSARLQSATPREALSVCRAALVGRGTLQATVALGGPQEVQVAGSVLAFNGSHDGKPSLLLHLYVSVPVSATLVIPLAISQHPGEALGTVLSGTIPKLAGGLGSITEIRLRLGRTYRYRGKQRGYVSAACAAPAGFTEAVFPFAQGTFRFAGGQRIVTTLTRQCRVRRAP